MIRTLLLEALWGAVRHHAPAAPKSLLNLHFPKPSAAVHARSNTPLMLAGQCGWDPLLTAKKIQDQLMEEWRDQFTTAVTPRGALAFRLSDSFIWSHATEAVRQWLPEAIRQAIASHSTAAPPPVLPSELRHTIQLSIIHLDGALLMLANNQPNNAAGHGEISSWHLPHSPSNPHRTPLLSLLLLLPEHLAQHSLQVAMWQLIQQFNSYRSEHPIVGKDGVAPQAVAGSLALLREVLRLVEHPELSS